MRSIRAAASAAALFSIAVLAASIARAEPPGLERWQEHHPEAARELGQWTRRHPEAAHELMNHPGGLQWAGHHLYQDSWHMDHPYR